MVAPGEDPREGLVILKTVYIRTDNRNTFHKRYEESKWFENQSKLILVA